MKRFTFLLCLMACCFTCVQSQEPAPEVIDLEAQAAMVETGNLSSRFLMPLQWAASSQIACFPATRFYEYKGHHLFYRVQMPANSLIKITVTPNSKKHRINLYALRLGANNYDTPPEIASAISCEAAYPIYAGKPNDRAPAKPKSVEYMSINRPYNILIGVAGAEGVTEGDFELKIEITSR